MRLACGGEGGDDHDRQEDEEDHAHERQVAQEVVAEVSGVTQGVNEIRVER